MTFDKFSKYLTYAVITISTVYISAHCIIRANAAVPKYMIGADDCISTALDTCPDGLIYDVPTLRNIINKYPKLKPIEDSIIAAQTDYPSINARFIIGVAITESSAGNAVSNNNLFGVTGYSNGRWKIMSYPSEQDAFDAWIKLVEKAYLKDRRTTPRKFVEKYNPTDYNYLQILLANINSV